jgi:5-methylcytosine-specific restriction endonuclease McrA
MAIIYQNDTAGKICANPECGWKPLSEFYHSSLHGRPVGDGYKSRCRECARAQGRAERAANLEHYRAVEREYAKAHEEHYRELKRSHRQANPEKYREAGARYCETHRAEINAKARDRRQKDLEHYREIGRKSYERHAEDRRQYSLDYFKLHPEKSVAANNRRRARKHTSGGSHTEEQWQAMKAFYDYRCLCCGKREPEIRLTRDHVMPLTKGGTDSIDNIQPLCARCNSKKNFKHIDYR